MKFVKYLKNDIWNVRIASLPKGKAFRIGVLRFFVLVSQGFTKKQIQLGASVLTYYSLLSVVPVLAFLLALTKGFLVQKSFTVWLAQYFKGESAVINKLLEFADLALQKTGGSILALFGLILMIWAGIKILIYIEWVMNDIWEVKNGRSLPRKFTDYLAIMAICPFFVLLSVILTAYVSAGITDLDKKMGLAKHFTPLIIFSFNIIPFILSWLLFTFIYIFIPYIRVRFFPALYAALITGAVYQVVQWGYFTLQLGMSRYNEIYGAFAAVPLFLIWLHFNWVLLFVGSKIAFSFQNIDYYEFMNKDMKINKHIEQLLSLRIAHFCVKKFAQQLPAPTIDEIAHTLQIPMPITKALLNSLVSSKVLAEQLDEKFQPALPLDLMTIKQILDMLDDKGEQILVTDEAETQAIKKSLEGFSRLIEDSPYNLRLSEI